MKFESSSIRAASKCGFGTGISRDESPNLDYLLSDQRRMAKAANYFAWQSRLVLPEIGRRVIEVGCGTGNFTQFLLQRELVVAIDVEPVCVDTVTRRYPGQTNLTAEVMAVTSAEFESLKRYRPQSCVCLNVLEHIEDDQAAVRAMASVVEPGGSIVLLLPAFPSLYGPVDRNLRHVRRYRKRDVRELAAAADLKIRRMNFMNAIGMIGWWANGRLFGVEANPAWQIELFDKLVAPVMSRLERVVPPPFGQSLFVVLEKPCR